MRDLTITEECSCGGRFAITADGLLPTTARKAVESWRGTHRHAESVGICGDRPKVAGFPEHLPTPYCALKAGHAGMHGDGDGAHWTTDPTIAADRCATDPEGDA